MRNKRSILSLFIIFMMFILASCGPTQKRAVTVPRPDTNTYVYTGNPIFYNIERSTLYTVENTVQTNAGTYDIIISLRDKNNYAWVTTTTSDDIIYKFVISPKAILKPTVETTNYNFTGNEITFDIPESNEYTISNNKATAAGNYTSTVSLKDKTNYVWNDGTKDDLTFNFSIINVDLSYATVEGVNSSYVYTGGAIRPVPTIKFGNEQLVLNKDFRVTYQNNINVGEASLTIEGIGNYNGSKQIKFNITKADPEITAPTAKALTYTGNELALINAGHTSGGEFEYKVDNGTYSTSIPKATNAGTYRVYYRVKGNNNYNDVPESYIDVNIAKATYDMRLVKFNNATYTYDGTQKELAIAGELPQGVTVSYVNNKLTNAGTVTATAKFIGDTTNYEPIEDLEATLTINKATYNMSGIKFENATYTYDGAEKELLISGELPNGVTVSYEANKGTNAGTYNAIAKFVGDSTNYEAINNLEATLTINKATYDMSGIKFENATYTYDGAEKELLISGELPEGVTVSYETNKGTNAGTYEAVAKFSGDSTNYELINDMEAKLVINKATYDMSGVKFENTTYTFDGEEKEIKISGNLPTGVTVSYQNNKLTNAGSSLATAKFVGDANHNDIANMTATLTINKADSAFTLAPAKVDNLIYNGEAFELITAGTGTGGQIEYKLGNGNYSTSIPKATNAGDYEVFYKITGDANHNDTEAVKIEVSIAKATYDMSGVKFNDLTVDYDGKEKELVITGNLPTGVTVSYEDNKLTDAGKTTATAKFTVNPNYNDIDDLTAILTINKIDAVITKDPKAVSNLVYNGNILALITKGEATGGVIEYKLNDEAYSTNVPSMIDAGNYKVYYKVIADKNHNDIEEQLINVSISKATPEVVLETSNELVYNGNSQELIIDATTTGGTLEFKLDDDYSTSIPEKTNAGTYKIYYKVVGNKNYNDLAESFIEVTIAKADPIVTLAPTPSQNLVYDGHSHKLLTAGTAEGGTIYYGLWDKNFEDWNNWSQGVPGQDIAGTWKVCYEVRGDENHNDLAPVGFEVVIAKGTYNMENITFVNKTEKYTGSEIELLITGALPTGVTVSYENNKLTNVGSIEATAKFDGDYANYEQIADMKATLTIIKTDSLITVAPIAINNLVYTTQAQELIVAGETSDGTLMYKLDDGEYSTSIPKATNAGEYKVWYKIIGDGNHEDLEEELIGTIKIDKAIPTVTAPVAIANLVYTGEALELATEGSTNGGEMVYSLDDVNFVSYIPKATDADTYKIYYMVCENANYKRTDSTYIEVTIGKADATVTAPTEIENLVYDKTAQNLINAATTTGGTVLYSLDNINYSATIPTGTDAGSYDIYYKLDGGKNYKDQNAKAIANSIAKADPIVTAPSALNPTYDGNELELITAGSTTGGTLMYLHGDITTDYVSDHKLLKATNAGNYIIYYKVVGDRNYNDVAEASLTSRILPIQLDYDTLPTAIENLVYDGTAKALITEATASYGEIQYKLNDGEYSTTLPTATNAGDYKVYYKLVGDNNHSGKVEALINVSIAKADVVINNAPTPKENLVYNGSLQNLFNATGLEVIGGELLYGKWNEYSDTWNDYQDSIYQGRDAGTYKVCYRVVGDENHNSIDPVGFEVEIAKATPVLTAPTSKALLWNDTEQVLVTAGSTTGGELQYSLGDNEHYSTDIPTAKDVGTYRIYYRVVGGNNYTDIAEAYITSTISSNKIPATFKTIPSIKTGLVYTGSAQELINAGSTECGTLKYKLGTGEYLEDIPTGIDAGSYQVYYKIFADDSHLDSSEYSLTITIGKATPTVTNPTRITGLVYTGSALELIAAGSTTGGELQYSLGDEDHYSTAIPTAINANATNEYYVIYYKVVGDANYNGTASKTITSYIDKANASYTAPTDKSLVYTGSAQELIGAPTSLDGTFSYRLVSETDYYNTIPTAVNANTYTIWYKLTPDSNHKGFELSITVTISKATYDMSGITFTNKAVDYDGTAQTLEIEGTLPTGVTVAYYYQGLAVGDLIDAGSYEITASFSGNANYNSISNKTATLTINKIDATASATPAENLVYTGASQQLITATSVTGGTLQFRYSTGNPFTTIPTATNAGSVDIWYRAVGDKNHNSTEEIKLTIVIAKAAAVYTAPTAKVLTYTGSAQSLVNAGSSYQTIKYSLDNSTFNTTIPTATNAGDYIVYYQVLEDNNHNGAAVQRIDVNIAKANASYSTAPAKKTNLVYNRALQELITAGATSCGEIQYKLDGGEYSTTIPSATDHGYYKVYYKLVGDANHNDIAESYFENIEIAQLELTSGNTNIVLSQNTYTFNNAACTPAVTSVVVSNYQLPAQAYYNVTYDNNINAGTASVIITAIDSNYTGSVTKNFTINRKAITGAAVTLNANSFVYNGSAQHPEVTSIILDEISITSDDYDISYPNSVNVGTNYTLTITAKRNYQGTLTQKYSITNKGDGLAANTTITLSVDSFTFNYTEQKPTVTIRDKRDNTLLVENTDYSLTYNNDLNNSGTSGAGNTTDAGTITITATGMGNIYAGTIQTTYVINKKTLDTSASNFVVSFNPLKYNGTSQTPTIANAYDGGIEGINITNLVEVAQGSAKTNAGTYQAIVKFNANNKNYEALTTTVTRDFTISPKAATSLTIDDIDDIPYTTSVKDNGATPTVTVKDGILPLELGTDYEVEYSNNTGTDITSTNLISVATVTVTFKGNYTGTKSKTFNIVNSEFTITYVNDTNQTSQKYHAADSSVILITPAKMGYEGNWNNPTKGNFDFGATTNPDALGGNITLTAIWEAIEYTVTYYLTGGTNGANLTTYTVETDEFTLLAPTRANANFLGWYNYVDNQANDDYTGNTITTIAGGTIGDISLYAKWEFVEYDITYHLDGGTNSANNPAKVTPATNFTLENATKAYYKFIGWYTTDSYQTKVEVLSGVEADMDLWAKFELEEYTITYLYRNTETNGNVINVTNSNVTKYKLGDSVILSNASAFTYQFNGWFKDSTLTTPATIDSNAPATITIYGSFTPSHTTSQTYLDDSPSSLPGSVSSNMSSKLVGENVTFTASVNAGYTFLGWFKDDATTAVDYSENPSWVPSTSVTFELTTTTTIYKAKYAYYTFTYASESNAKGSVSATGTITDGHVRAKTTITLHATTNNGYTFIGWFKNGSSTPEAKTLTYAYEMEYSNIAFVAKWIQVTLDTNDSTLGTVSTLESTYIVGNNVTITATPTNSSFIFLGWYKDNEATACSYDLSYEITMPNVDASYEAKFTVNYVIVKNNYVLDYNYTEVNESPVYTLTCKTNNNITEQATYVVNEDKITYTMPQTNTEYLFAGWWYIPNTNDPTNKELVDANTGINWSCTLDVPTSTTTIYALWVDPHVTTYLVPDSNYISVSSTVDLVTAGATYTADDNVENFDWVGWYSNEECTQLVTKDNELTVPYSVYQKLIYNDNFAGIDLTYYAKWMLNGVEVTCTNGNGTASASEKVNNTWTLTATAASGYVFKHWEYNSSTLSSDNPLVVTEGGTYDAVFTERTDMPYKEIIYYQNLNNDNYSEHTITIHENQNGAKTGTSVTFTASSFTGLKLSCVKVNGSSLVLDPTNLYTDYSLSILAEKDTTENASTIEFYYNLNTVDVRYHLNNGQTVFDENSGLVVPTPAKYDLEHNYYVLQTINGVTWYTNKELSGSPITTVLASTDVYACWNGNNHLDEIFDMTPNYTKNYYTVGALDKDALDGLDILIPDYIEDMPVKKVNVDNIYGASYSSLTMPSTLTNIEYGKYGGNAISWIILNESNGTYKLLSEGTLGNEVFTIDDTINDYTDSSIKTYVDSIMGQYQVNSIELLSLSDYNLYHQIIEQHTITSKWWLQTFDYDPDFGDPIILYVDGTQIKYDGYITDPTFIINDYAVRPTITLTIPSTNTTS